MKAEPFSLRWYLKMHGNAIGKALGAYSISNSVHSKYYERYRKLAIWLEDRMVEKFDK